MANAIDLMNEIIKQIESNEHFVYKFWTINEWNERKKLKNIYGSKFDKNDGFIHMCTYKNCQRIDKIYFKNEKSYYITKINVNKLKNIKWELIINGDFYPHLYNTIPFNSINKIYYVNHPKTFDFTSLN